MKILNLYAGIGGKTMKPTNDSMNEVARRQKHQPPHKEAEDTDCFPERAKLKLRHLHTIALSSK